MCFLAFLTGCGFKLVNQNYLSNYKLIEIEAEGDNRISYLLKNKLRIFNEEAPKSLKLKLNVTKSKNINEKIFKIKLQNMKS